MQIKTFKDGMIRSYKIEACGIKIMLDFNGNIQKEDIEDVDIIYLSHEHFDHFKSLLDYNLVLNLKPDVKIYATTTTKNLIKMLAEEYLLANHYIDKVYNYITSLIDKIIPCYFKEENVYNDDIKFILHRSGHTFGSSMIHLITKDYSLLYTGDMDYVSSDPNRQYELPYIEHLDYIIADGTNIVDTEYKGLSIANIKKYIDNKKKGSIIYYYAKEEKAVFYALKLAQKTDSDILITYDKTIYKYIEEITKQGYSPFILNRVILLDDDKNNYKDQKLIIFTNNQNNFSINEKLSLHITRAEFHSLLQTYISNDPIVLIGHYDNKLSLKPLENVKTIFLKEGINNV